MDAFWERNGTILQIEQFDKSVFRYLQNLNIYVQNMLTYIIIIHHIRHGDCKPNDFVIHKTKREGNVGLYI